VATFVIEHLEPVVTPWAYLEYKHAAQLAPRLIITNVRNEGERACLEPYVDVMAESVAEVAKREEILVLDPRAARPLSSEDFERFEYVVVGGIMGDYPPRGRTQKLLTSRLGAEARNLGACQLSVDGAVYVAAQVARGIRLGDVVVARGVALRSGFVEVHLPYCYPVGRGGLVLSRELAAYILTLLEDDEEYAARTGSPRSIADYGCRLEVPPVDYEVEVKGFARLADLVPSAANDL